MGGRLIVNIFLWSEILLSEVQIFSGGLRNFFLGGGSEIFGGGVEKFSGGGLRNFRRGG